jgi:predicted metal-binding membrane protein
MTVGLLKLCRVYKTKHKLFVMFCCCRLGMVMLSVGKMVLFWLMHIKDLFDVKIVYLAEYV